MTYNTVSTGKKNEIDMIYRRKKAIQRKFYFLWASIVMDRSIGNYYIRKCVNIHIFHCQNMVG